MTGRSVPEWIGKTPDSPVPPRVRIRRFAATAASVLPDDNSDEAPGIPVPCHKEKTMMKAVDFTPEELEKAEALTGRISGPPSTTPSSSASSPTRFLWRCRRGRRRANNG